MSRQRGDRTGRDKVRFLQAGRRESGLRLDLFLVGALPDLSRKQAKRLIDGRRVAVNDRLEPLASRQLRGGDRVEVQMVEEGRVPDPPARLTVLYEDAHGLAVNKPAGLPSGPTRDPARPHVASLASDQCGCQLTLLHRLDRDTTGVLLLAKTREFAAALNREFKHRRIEKRYLALVRGRPPGTTEIVSHLREGEGGRMLTVRSGGVRASTGFRTVCGAEEFWVVEAQPRTGRTHQIRVHLARGGCPILGDALYGGDSRVGDVVVSRQMLHAYSLHFVHPQTSASVLIRAPLPADFHEIAVAAMGAHPAAPLRAFVA